MAMITLHNASLPEVTILSNTFIDNYMPEANGEFVKVYIYLLRALSSAPVSFSLEQMADRLLCTERDILRALKYWAKPSFGAPMGNTMEAAWACMAVCASFTVFAPFQFPAPRRQWRCRHPPRGCHEWPGPV